MTPTGEPIEHQLTKQEGSKMKLKHLLLFEKNSHGGVNEHIIQQLNLPMPDDVLEQFIIDFGTDSDFQSRYGEIDLHQLTWAKQYTGVEQLLSVDSKFDDYVKNVSQRDPELIISKGYTDHESRRRAEFWLEHKTWGRSPVFFSQSLLNTDKLHLIEGHTRIGRLQGLYATDPNLVAAEHLIWVGNQTKTHQPEGNWRDILATHHISFMTWLTDYTIEDNDKRFAASTLVNGKNFLKRNAGSSLDDLLKFTQQLLDMPMARPDSRHQHDDIRRTQQMLPMLYEEFQSELNAKLNDI